MSSGPPLTMNITGAWAAARKAIGTKLAPLIKQATLQEAMLGERIMKRYVTDAGGQGWVAPLSPWTLASRRLGGPGGKRPKLKGTKPLIATGDMRNNITHKVEGGAAFVGLMKSAKRKDGKGLVDLAAVHEFGKTIVIRITPKMRKFMAILAREVGDKKGAPTGSGATKTFLVIRIKARPFIRPSFEQWSTGTGPAMILYTGIPADRRMLMRVADLAQKKLGMVAK